LLRHGELFLLGEFVRRRIDLDHESVTLLPHLELLEVLHLSSRTLVCGKISENRMNSAGNWKLETAGLELATGNELVAGNRQLGTYRW
jgi:hypothetical protein